MMLYMARSVGSALVLAVAVVVMCGCGANRALVGRQSFVESIPGSQPAWYGRPGGERDGRLFFSGMVDGRVDYALAMREARAEAEKGLAEMVRQRLRVEFGAAVEGDNRDAEQGRYARDIIVKATEKVAISGARLEDQYARRFEERTPEGVRYVWQASALVTVPRDEYLEARRAALGEALTQARAIRNEAARKLLEEAFERMEAEGAAVPGAGR